MADTLPATAPAPAPSGTEKADLPVTQEQKPIEEKKLEEKPSPLPETEKPQESNQATIGAANKAATANEANVDEGTEDFEGDVEVSKELPTQQDMEKVANLLILDHKGESRPFKSLYTGENITKRQLIIFVRHFFCGLCQDYLRVLCAAVTPEALLSLEKPTFITVIGCGRPDLIDMYAQATNCPFPIYADPTKQLYEHLGMSKTLDRGPKPEYNQSSFISGIISSIGQGVRSGRAMLKGGDIKQVGGEFLIDEQEVKWCHRMRNTRDHTEVPELKRVIGLKVEEEDPAAPKKNLAGSIKNMRQRSASWGRSKSISKDNGATEEKKDGTGISNKPDEPLVTNGQATTS